MADVKQFEFPGLAAGLVAKASDGRLVVAGPELFDAPVPVVLDLAREAAGAPESALVHAWVGGELWSVVSGEWVREAAVDVRLRDAIAALEGFEPSEIVASEQDTALLGEIDDAMQRQLARLDQDPALGRLFAATVGAEHASGPSVELRRWLADRRHHEGLDPTLPEAVDLVTSAAAAVSRDQRYRLAQLLVTSYREGEDPLPKRLTVELTVLFFELGQAAAEGDSELVRSLTGRLVPSSL